VQQREIAQGRQLLLGFFGPAVDPIFTPPWNRWASFTWRCLLDSGLTAISRDRTAAPLAREQLPECAIHVDWFARVEGRGSGRRSGAGGWRSRSRWPPRRSG
jgi:hypothetical protein